MTIDQILELSKAGFTAEQITALAPMINTQTPTPDPQPAPAPAPDPQPAPAPAPNPQPAPAAFSGVESKMDELIAMLRAGAVNNSNQPATQTQSAEDILACIVNPKTK